MQQFSVIKIFTMESSYIEEYAYRYSS